MEIQKISKSYIKSANFKTKSNKENKNTENKNYTSSLNCLGNYNKAQVSFGARLNTDGIDLSRPKLRPNFRASSHSLFMLSRIMMHPRRHDEGMWTTFRSEDGTHCPWKMHLYADNEEDLQKLCVLMAPYLRMNDVSWKTLGACMKIDTALNLISQKGKAITIYPHSNDEFARLAHDINFIIKNNNLEISDTKIKGDRQLGDSGRIFYRYEYKSKEHQNLDLNINDDENYKKYREIYEPARENDNYLACDMTQDDDIWFNFNPDIDGAKDID